MLSLIAKTQVKNLRFFFGSLVYSEPTTPTLDNRRDLQFSKRKLIDFGELPFGDIPEALAVNRPTSLAKLGNKIRVGCETWNAPNIAITVTVKAGSRQQSLETSSVAQFAAHGALLGTQKYSKTKIEELIDSIGGKLTLRVTRELSEYTLSFEKQCLDTAIGLLSELVLRPVYEAVSIEALKRTLHKNASPMDPEVIVSESLHFAMFRDHFLGQPSYGIRDNIYSISAQQVKSYHDKFYVGENIVISGAGDLDHKSFTQAIASQFGGATEKVKGDIPNIEQVYQTPSTMFIRDDEMVNSAYALGFKAPTFNHPHYFAMQYFKRLIGNYRCDKFTGTNLNAPHLQYNGFHKYLGERPGIYLHKPFYISYSDTALFGNFIFGNEVFNQEMLLITQNKMSCYSQDVPIYQVFRSRNKYWNDLLTYNDPEKVSLNNNKHISYLDRIIGRTEAARRASYMKVQILQDIAHEWFFDKSITAVGYGNLHNTMTIAYYSRPVNRSTLGYATIHRIHAAHVC